MKTAAIRHENIGRLDITQLHDVYRTYVDRLEHNDSRALASLYDDKAVVIANKELSRLSGMRMATGVEAVQKLFEGYCTRGRVESENPWEYVQGNDALLVRARTRVGGELKDTFGFFAFKQGKIWRQIIGIEEERTRGVATQFDPARMHPMFGKLAGGLVDNRVEALMDFYSPDSVGLFASSKSWSFRVRGVAEGRKEIQQFLTAYMERGEPHVVELRDYAEAEGLVYTHGLMSRDGVLVDSHGGYLIENDRIVVGWSSS